MRVAAVDDDVAGFEMGQHGVDHLIDRVAGFDHHHDAARPLKQADELLEWNARRRPECLWLHC
jgi:hypothetical protein